MSVVRQADCKGAPAQHWQGPKYRVIPSGWPNSLAREALLAVLRREGSGSWSCYLPGCRSRFMEFLDSWRRAPAADPSTPAGCATTSMYLWPMLPNRWGLMPR